MSGFNNGYMGGNYLGYQPQPMQFQRPMVGNNFSQNDFQERGMQYIRIVESENSVVNVDVPMDGNPYYFIKADATEIYSKFWTRDMKTKINKYVLVNEDEVTKESKPELDEVLKGYFETLDKNLSTRIDSINENILNLNKPIQKNAKTTKEV